MWLDGGLCSTACEHLQPNYYLEFSGQAAYMTTLTLSVVVGSPHSLSRVVNYFHWIHFKSGKVHCVHLKVPLGVHHTWQPWRCFGWRPGMKVVEDVFSSSL